LKSKKKKLFILIIIIILLAAAFFLVKDIVLKSIYPLRYENEINRYADDYKLDHYLVASVIWAESKYDPDAVSKRGAIGLMQIMPDTGEWIAGKLNIENYKESLLTDPQVNIRMGCWYLRYLSDKFTGDTRKILAGYNAGPNKVQNWLKDKDNSSDGKELENIPYEETKNYVDKIVRAYEVYKSLYKIPSEG